MCGICIAHGIDNPAAERPRLIACSKKIRHRGPDWSGCYSGKQTILAHERLAIVGVGESIANSVKTEGREFMFNSRRHRRTAACEHGREDNPCCERRDLQPHQAALAAQALVQVQDALRLRGHHPLGTPSAVTPRMTRVLIPIFLLGITCSTKNSTRTYAPSSTACSPSSSSTSP